MRALAIVALTALSALSATRVWEKQEVVLTAQQKHENPYPTVDVWVDLKGPGFAKRVFGFWDGGATYRVRFLAAVPGQWTWTSGSSTSDPGLNGKTGSFTAAEWTEAEKQQNLTRRGFIRPTASGHALELADGTPFFLLGDTWWATPTFRFPWTDDDAEHPLGPQATFKDYVRFRKQEGFNSIAILAALPQWAEDGKPARIVADDKMPVRLQWPLPGTDLGKAMHNEGGRPFLFPGRVPKHEDVVPDLDRINPAYFQHLDKKIDYLNSQGFIPFLEVARRDVIPAWQKYHKWPDSYARYVQYIFARYQANNAILSPIHFDTPAGTIPPLEFNAVVNYVIKRWGKPPFGSPLSTNSNPTSLLNFGAGDDASWVDIHQTGNQREHEHYWHHTETFHTNPAKPSLSGEPYYAGWLYASRPDAPHTAEPGSDKDDRFCRSAMYGNFLSGGLAGHIYGAEGIWQAAIEPAAPVKMWEAFLWKSSSQMQHFRSFVFSQGRRFQDLIPATDHLVPNSDYRTIGYEGWAFAARSANKDWFLVYLEKGVPEVTVRSLPRGSRWSLKWFNPRTGEWTAAGKETANQLYKLKLPAPPTDDDWALSMTRH